MKYILVIGVIVASSFIYWSAQEQRSTQTVTRHNTTPKSVRRPMAAERAQRLATPLTKRRSSNDQRVQITQQAVERTPTVSQPLDQVNRRDQIARRSQPKVMTYHAQDRDQPDQELDVEEPEDDLVFSTDREGIKFALNELKPDLLECYDAWLKSHAELQGRMTVAFVIESSSPEGEEGEAEPYARVKEAQLLVDDLAHPMMKGCLLNSVEGLKFEPVDKPIKVNYPFSFAPSK